MLKKFGVKGLMSTLALLILCLGGCFLFGPSDGNKPQTPTVQTILEGNATAESPQPETGVIAQEQQGALDLMLKDIDLSQGEGGIEVWRLHAQWANMQKKDGVVFIDQPRLTYFMNEDGKILYVRSEQGDIEQKKQIIRFVDKVHVTQDDKSITGDLLVYNGTAKTMTFPEGGDFRASGVNGTAMLITWHINDQHIEAEGAVSVDFEGGNATGAEDQTEDRPE